MNDKIFDLEKENEISKIVREELREREQRRTAPKVLKEYTERVKNIREGECERESI